MTPPAEAPRPALGQSLYIFGVTAIVVALIMLPFAFFSRLTLQEYAKDGITANATVLEKKIEPRFRSGTRYSVRVSFFTKPILEGGELVMTTINTFVSGAVWDTIEEQEQVEVIYLMDDPETQVIFKASLDDAYFPPIQRYEVVFGVLALGSFLIWLSRRPGSLG